MSTRHLLPGNSTSSEYVKEAIISNLYSFLFLTSLVSRVSQYVFVPTKEEVFTVIDQHADTLDGDVKSPLVLVGNEGKHQFSHLSLCSLVVYLASFIGCRKW